MRNVRRRVRRTLKKWYLGKKKKNLCNILYHILFFGFRYSKNICQSKFCPSNLWLQRWDNSNWKTHVIVSSQVWISLSFVVNCIGLFQYWMIMSDNILCINWTLCKSVQIKAHPWEKDDPPSTHSNPTCMLRYMHVSLPYGSLAGTFFEGRGPLLQQCRSACAALLCTYIIRLVDPEGTLSMVSHKEVAHVT